MSDSTNYEIKDIKIINVVDTYAKNSYLNNLKVFRKKVSTAEQVKEICLAWVDALQVDVSNNGDARQLVADLENLANEIKEDTTYSDISDYFQSAAEDVKKYMIQHEYSIGTMELVNQTGLMLKDPEPDKEAENRETIDAYSHAFASAYSDYLERLVGNAKYEFFPITKEGKKPEERLEHCVQSASTFLNGTYLQGDLLKQFPMPTLDDVLVVEKKDAYIARVEEYLKNNVKKDDLGKVHLSIETIRKETGKLLQSSKLEKPFQEAMKVIRSEAYTWEERRVFLKKLHKRLSSIEGVGEKIEKIDAYLDTTEHASEWLNKVAQSVGKQELKHDTVVAIGEVLHDSCTVTDWAVTDELEKDQGLLAHCSTEIRNLKQAVRGADPLLMKSSVDYKFYKETVMETEELINRYQKDLDRKGTLEWDQVLDLIEAANMTERRATHYAEYKMEALNGKAPNHTELKRLQAAELGHACADNIRRAVITHTLQNAKKKSQLDLLENVNELMLGGVVRHPHHLAELLYLENVRQMYGKKPGGFNMQEALSYDNIQEGARKIEQDPAFKKVARNMDLDPESAEAQRRYYHSYMNYKQAERARQQQPRQRQQNNNQLPRQGGPQVQGPGPN